MFSNLENLYISFKILRELNFKYIKNTTYNRLLIALFIQCTIDYSSIAKTTIKKVEEAPLQQVSAFIGYNAKPVQINVDEASP
jgi:hypothetical protein